MIDKIEGIGLIPLRQAKPGDYKQLDKIAKRVARDQLRPTEERGLYEQRGFGLIEDLERKVGCELARSDFSAYPNSLYYDVNVEEFSILFPNRPEYYKGLVKRIFVDKSLLPKARIKFMRSYYFDRGSDDPTTNNYFIKVDNQIAGFAAIWNGLISASGEVSPNPDVECLFVNYGYRSLLNEIEKVVSKKVESIGREMSPFVGDLPINPAKDIFQQADETVKAIRILKD